MNEKNRKGDVDMADLQGRRMISRQQPDARKVRTSAYMRNGAVLCVFLFSMGFPGKMAGWIGGEKMSMLIQYFVFVLQILFMLLSSGETFMDIKLVDLKREFKPVYVLIGVFFVVSMAVTHDRGDQLISCLRFSVTALFALWIIEWYDVKQILRFTYYAQTVMVMLCVFYMFAFSGQAFEVVDGQRSFVGIFPGKNVCGAELGFGLSMQAALLRLYWDEDRQPSVFFFLIMLCQVILLVMTKAMGSLISAGIPIAYVMFSRHSRGLFGRLPMGLIYVIGSVGFMLFALNLMPLLSPLLEAIGKDATLTGRIPMWQQHVNNMMNSHTFTGYGFGMFWKNEQAVAAFHAGFDQYSWAGGMATGAHNELIEMWLDCGLIGLAVFFAMIFLSFRKMREVREDAYVFCITLMLGMFIKGLTERVHSTASFWTLYMFLSCGLALKYREKPGLQ